MTIKIYHNPRCSKSRQTLQLLIDNNVDAEVIEYLQSPPTIAEIKIILNALNMHPRELMRKKEVEYKDNNLDDGALSTDDLIAAMIKYPKIIERPIVINSNNQCAIGRPPESVLAIIK